MSHFTLAVLHYEPYEDLDEMLAPFDEATTDPDFLTFREDEDGPLDEKTGKHGYYSNKNAKYDWFVPGGRWRGLYPNARWSGGSSTSFPSSRSSSGR